VESGELPELTGPSRVVLMVVNPYLVHAYWDVNPIERPTAETAASSGRLRFHEASNGQEPTSFDVYVDLTARNWYIPLWSPEKRYYAELGLSREDGGLTALARSNAIETPRAWPVAQVQERFLRVGESPQPVEVAPPQPAAAAPWPIPQPVTTPISSQLAETTRIDALSVPPEEPVARPHTVAAAPAARPAEPPEIIPVPRSADATEVLRQRLTDLYALRWWRDRPAGALPPLPPDLQLPALSDPPRDLTSRTEAQFSPGFSSALLGLGGSKKPAG